MFSLCPVFPPFQSILYISTRIMSLTHKPDQIVSLLNPLQELSTTCNRGSPSFYMHSCILLYTESHNPQLSLRLTDSSRIACIHRCRKMSKWSLRSPPMKVVFLTEKQEHASYEPLTRRNEFQLFSRLPTLLPFTFHTRFPSFFSRQPVYFFNKYLFIHK